MRTRLVRLLVILALLLSTMTSLGFAAAQQAGNPSTSMPGRYLVALKSTGDARFMQAQITEMGATVVQNLAPLNLLVVHGTEQVKQRLKADPRVSGVATDRIQRIVPPELAPDMFSSPQAAEPIQIDLTDDAQNGEITGDPAFDLSGLMWNIDRIEAPDAWETTSGEPEVLVGVADTGLDSTHVDLEDNIHSVVDFTEAEDPPICDTFFGVSDQALAAQFGGPADGDWNGHGSWIGGNIAAVLNEQGVNGVAPNVKLVSLKISQWCGYAYDSTILSAFLYAASNDIDVVSLSFGGYLDRSDPEQDLIYSQYASAVALARSEGTVIVAAAGNEHVEIGDGGQVLSSGMLTTPGTLLDGFLDLQGLYEIPGGIPGVVTVGSTGNMVNEPSDECPEGTTEGSLATCKPEDDPHQPFGAGEENQLAYYSNYGPRIDLVAPGGSRMFNLPLWDRGGTPGFPYTIEDEYTAWQTFSTTSNWALYTAQIPCFLFIGGGFPAGQCYTTIQGTSMATPHVSAVLALVASANPDLRGDPDRLVEIVKETAQPISGNETPPLDPSDTSPGDIGGPSCPTGYCHLGGDPIPDEDAYGAGLVDAAAAVEAAMEEDEAVSQSQP